MAQRPPLLIPNDRRGFVFGISGSGKSTLSQVLIQDKKHLICIDPKGEFEPFQEYDAFRTVDELVKAGNRLEEKALVFRPKIGEDTWLEIGRVLDFAFERRETFVYIDETTEAAPSASKYPASLRRLYVQGRSRNCGVLATSQRPRYLPRFIYSESEFFWQFYLTLKDDLNLAAEFMGDNVLHRLKERYGFYHYNTLIGGYRDTGAKPYELDLKATAKAKGV